jgi:hypothetical protein
MAARGGRLCGGILMQPFQECFFQDFQVSGFHGSSALGGKR